ncbi:hypothetical protein EAH79_00175 [Sphingomonas koreensis]|nr:hypothetical protein EAH87_10985 [Sphingomonas koreensis]TPG42369.1 hypothetical protein EAH79_00175 [Sphingomonas koreensis]
MADRTPSPTPSSAAGGVLLALGLMGGSVVGLAMNQPTIGFLIGGAIGIAAAIAVWLRDRR